MRLKKVYVAGKITGLPYNETVAKFAHYCAVLQKKGYKTVSPIEIAKYEHGKTWKAYMLECIPELIKCETIYMLPCWKESKGARLEHQIAKELELEIIYITDMKIP